MPSLPRKGTFEGLLSQDVCLAAGVGSLLGPFPGFHWEYDVILVGSGWLKGQA